MYFSIWVKKSSKEPAAAYFMNKRKDKQLTITLSVVFWMGLTRVVIFLLQI